MTDLSESPIPSLPTRRRQSHKGDFGRVAVVGGSLGMAGAPALAGMAALRAGAGLVGVATARCVQATVASFSPAYMTQGLPDDGERISEHAEPALLEALDAADGAAIGPGLGRAESVTRLVGAAWTAATPLVIDADGLNALAATSAGGATGGLTAPSAARILTPHAGEFARLRGGALSDPDNDEQRRQAAGDFARSLGCDRTVVVLKGSRTVVTDGRRYAVNTTGNPGMATGGSGDVLTGVLAALLAQGLEAFDAARLGVHVHGLAGDIAAQWHGQTAMTAVDIVAALGEAWRRSGTAP